MTRIAVALLAASFALSPAMAAGPVHHRTLIVDPQGTPDANFETISDAITDISPQGNDVWTILIYAGEYDETLTLGLGKKYINLVGVDPEAVIIAPSSGAAITISGSGDRENHISNLTVKPANGDGIVLGSACSLTNVTVEVDGENTAVKADGKSDINISGCLLIGDEKGLELTGECEDVTVTSTQITANGYGVYIEDGDNISLLYSQIKAEASQHLRGVYIVEDESAALGDILIQGCRIEAIVTTAPSLIDYPICRALEVVDAPASGSQVRVVDCRLNATTERTIGEEAIGVYGGEADAVTVLGGVIYTTAADEKVTDLFDLYSNATGAVAMAGTRLSKWHGPIVSAERRRVVVQRALDADAADDDGIHAAYTLPETEGVWVNTGITDPDVYRVLSVKGNLLGMNQTVYIHGTDWAGNPITDAIQLSNLLTVSGNKAFMTVEKIFFPARGATGQTVQIGTSEKLGLFVPLGAAADVILQGELVSGVYEQGDPPAGGIDAVYSTIDPVPTISDGDSFEWTILATQ
jgi:hypothetical protein